MNAPPDQGISTDELAGISGLTGGMLNKAFADLEALGIARNDLAVTVFVHVAVEGHSLQRMAQSAPTSWKSCCAAGAETGAIKTAAWATCGCARSRETR